MSTVTRMLPVGFALALFAVAPAQAQARRGIDTKFEKVEEVAGIRLLFCSNGQSYRVKDNVWNFSKYKTLWVVLEKGDKIHVIVENGFLKGLKNGWQKTTHVNTQILQTVKRLKEGDKVDVNGERFQFIRKSTTHLTLSPKLPGGDFGYAGESRIPLGRIKKITIVTDDSEDEIGMANDNLTVFGVVEGDTVELKLTNGKKYVGVVTKLTPINCDLLRWGTTGRYGSLKSIRRRDVAKARHVDLSYQRAYRAGDGNMTMKVKRFRRAREGKTTWEVELSHDAPLSLLQPFKIKWNLFEQVNGTQALGEHYERVQQLFPNRKIRLKHTAINERYVDGTLEVPKLEVIAYSSDAAESAVLAAIDSARDERRLRGLYQGRLESQDPAFLHMLLSRVLVPPTGRSGAEVHAQLSVEMFRDSGEVGAEAIMHEIGVRADNLELTNLIDGELVRGPLPHDTDREDWRRKLIAQFLEQDGALEGGRAAKLFEFYCENEIFNLDVEKVFAAYPDLTVPALFDAAIPRKGSKGSQHKRRLLAATIIRNLKEKAWPGLSRELAARKIDAAKFDAACKKYGSAKAEKAIDIALDLAGEASRGEWLERLEADVNEARKLAKDRKYGPAMKLLREVLSQNPEFKPAQTAFPNVAVKLAKSMTSRGEACQLLEEAIKFSAQGKGPLGEFLLQGAKDDIDGIMVRDAPTHGATVVHRMEISQVLAGQREGEWVRVVVPGQKKPGFVHGKCVAPRGDGEFGPTVSATPFEVVQRLLERVKELNPDLAADADKQLGHLNARDGYALFKEEKYELAAPFFEKAELLAPDDPRLAEASSNWLKANANLVLLVLVFFGATGIAGFMVYKKLRAEMTGEDLSGVDLEILLELGVDEEPEEDDDDEEDFVFANAGSRAAS